jgi:trimeric autotransporter adhesin
METFTTQVSYLNTTFSYSNSLFASTSAANTFNQSDTSGVAGSASAHSLSSRHTSFSADSTQTVYTFASTFEAHGAFSNQTGTTVQTGSHDQTDIHVILSTKHISYSSSDRTVYHSRTQTVDTSVDTSTSSLTQSGLTTAPTTEVGNQITTTTSTFSVSLRTTTSTSTTRLNTSVLGLNTVTYQQSTSNHTTTTTSITTTQDGRLFTSNVASTFFNTKVLEATLIFAEAAQFLTGTRGNQILYVPTASATGFNDLGSMGASATSTELGSWSIAPVTFLQLTASTYTTTDMFEGKQFSVSTHRFSYSFNVHTIFATAASDSVSYHATRFKTSSITASGTTTQETGFTSSFVSSFTVGDESSSFFSFETFTYSSVTGTVTASTSSSTTATTGTTTTTSAQSYTSIPFPTASTTTSLTGFIETYTTSRTSRRTSTTVFSTTLAANHQFFTSSLVIVSALVNTITSTIQIPHSYHLESSTITVLTTILSEQTFSSTTHGNNGLLYFTHVILSMENASPEVTNPGTIRISVDSRTNQSSYTTATINTDVTSHVSSHVLSSTSEEMGLNGFIVSVDPFYMDRVTAQGGNCFNVDPNVAIGFRPATNESLTAPIYFSPQFSFPTFSMKAWSKFTTTTTSGTDTVSTTDLSSISVAKTQSTFAFSHITLHQFVSASIFVSNPFTQSSTDTRLYTSIWGSYKSFTTTTTVATTATTDPSTASTTSASLSTHASPFVVKETTISRFSGNTIFITRSVPAIFLTNDGGNRYFSHDERYLPAVKYIEVTETITINFGASVSDSTHLRNAHPGSFDSTTPNVYGGYHPVTSQIGFALMMAPIKSLATEEHATIGVAFKMTVAPRAGGATSTSIATASFYRISENIFTSVAQHLLTNNLSQIIAIEPLTMFSFRQGQIDRRSTAEGTVFVNYYTTTSRYYFHPDDHT